MFPQPAKGKQFSWWGHSPPWVYQLLETEERANFFKNQESRGRCPPLPAFFGLMATGGLGLGFAIEL